MKLRRLLYPAVAAVGIGALGAYAWQAQRQPLAPVEQSKSPQDAGKGQGQNKAAGPVAVDVAPVAAVRLVEDVNAVGTLRSNEAVMLRPEVAGRITRLNFSDGAQVRKGQVLVAFDASVNQAEVRQARAELGIARANFERNADLAKQKFISDRARDESQANVQVLEARLALAEARLSKLEIRAPFSGVVGIRNVSVGDYVKDGADLVNLEDISSVKVDFRIPERFIDMVKRGQSLEVAVDALPGKPFLARVEAIDPQIDSNGRAALLRGRIDNPEGRLKPGMFARVRLILSERENALMIPEEAIVPQGDKVTVWKLADGKAVRTEVRTGLRREARVEITEGLRAGDQVIVAGQVRLSRDNTPVRVINGGAGVQEAKPNAAAPRATANG
ncbi:efflux RND transporter periplasmic adaptor subunit [Noviherbaspirillum aridicola]|uniref:MexH family multidrug efflux RND transporter periplasmic adaptor subunit n=1 Tax=Noviherbaspirillum aridicola TaxID=2849687 RepID=A0ABQ4Q8Q3_9BURK|nr:efflux RND transporter periplasmic adaptor subunit [Noviherbaspirillum aridicola]GIZ53594.1 MexH family multidrug efflux RND transporter periplasmic adaptor subunit [Noviherbaspirillum aridicola]